MGLIAVPASAPRIILGTTVKHLLIIVTLIPVLLLLHASVSLVAITVSALRTSLAVIVHCRSMTVSPTRAVTVVHAAI